MAKEYLEKLTELLARVGDDALGEAEVECKHFFSGAAGYANGKICMSYTAVGFALKLPEDARDALMQEGARPLQYFPKAPIKKDYVVLPDAILEDTKALRGWVKMSVGYVGRTSAA